MTKKEQPKALADVILAAVPKGQTVELEAAPKLGLADIITAVRHLDKVGRILYIGAHPDDEPNSLLVYLDRHLGADVSLMTMNWGEGGDNAIGPELEVALGVLRSREGLAARRYDRARQLYAGSYDFGYSVSLRESLLGDTETKTPPLWNIDHLGFNMAKAIRAIRPDVVFCSHNAPNNDHGQHRATGWLAYYAILLAAQADYSITGDDGEALALWQVGKLYTPVYWPAAAELYRDDAIFVGPVSSKDIESPDLLLDLGTYDSALGRSYAEWGRVGRNMHKCQKMILIPRKGEQTFGFMLKYAAPGLDPLAEGVADQVFGGLDYACLTGLPGPGEALRELAGKVSRYQTSFKAQDPAANIEQLAAVRQAARQILDSAGTAGGADEDNSLLLRERMELLLSRCDRLMLDCLAISAEAHTTVTEVHPGQHFLLDLEVWKRNDAEDVVALENDEPLSLPEGWTAELRGHEELTQAGRHAGWVWRYEIQAAAEDRNYTGPFNAPHDDYDTTAAFPFGGVSDEENSIYETESQDPARTAEARLELQQPEAKIAQGMHTPVLDPYARMPVQFSVPLTILGEQITVGGEADVPLVPLLSVVLSRPARMLRYTGETLETVIEVVLTSQASQPVRDITVRADSGDDKITVAEVLVDTLDPAQTLRVELPVRISPGFRDEEAEIRVRACFDGHEVTEGFRTISYPHVHDVNYYAAAVQKLSVQAYRLASDDLRVGFVPGGGDDFVLDIIRSMYGSAAAGRQRASFMSAEDLMQDGTALLGRYDTIVVGKTALADQSPIHGPLRAAIPNLLSFVREGGNLVVHYQNWADRNGLVPLAPIPFVLGSTNINNEDCRVRVPESAAETPFYQGVNELELGRDEEGWSDSAVWDAWIQQRTEWTPGLNEAGQVEALEEQGYTVLFTGQDPESTERPAMIYRREGKGHYSYSAVVWDRQLAGLVPGAYKLYANLLSMGCKTDE